MTSASSWGPTRSWGEREGGEVRYVHCFVATIPLENMDNKD